METFFQVSGLYMFRLHPAVDVGAGAGTMRLSGEGFDPIYGDSRWSRRMWRCGRSRWSTEWKDSRWAGIIPGELETSFVTEGFTAAQFGTPASSLKTVRNSSRVRQWSSTSRSVRVGLVAARPLTCCRLCSGLCVAHESDHRFAA